MPLWFSVLCGLLLLAGLLRSGGRLRWGGRILAIALAAGLLVLMQDPLRVIRRGVPVPLRGVVVVDGSASVLTPLTGAERVEGLTQALADVELLQDPAIDWDVVSLRDATTTTHTLAQARSNPAALVPSADEALLHRTDLATLYQQAGRYDLALVLTDGHWWSYQSGPVASTSATLLGVRPQAWSAPAADVGFRRVRSEVIGLLRHKVRVEFELDVQGLGTATDISIQVESLGSQVVTTVTLEPGQAVTNVSMDLLVTQLGSTQWHARLIDVPAWDGYTLNNEVVFRVMGYREKIRTLLVSGGPGMDTRNIRAFLKSDPAVELMHFAILRTIDDDPRARNEELSLIPFPYDELFTQMLPQFDVVILQNFNYKPYFRQDFPKYFGNLAQSVHQSGTGLIMTGGPRSFGDGKYDQTVLGSVLGLDLRRTDGYESESALPALPGRVARDIPLPTLVPQVRYLNQVELQPGTVAGLRLASPLSATQGLPLAPPALLSFRRHGRGHAIGSMSPDLMVARSPAQFAALSGWFSQALRWAAGDLDQFALDVVVSEPVDDRSVDFRLQVLQPDAAMPLTAVVLLGEPGSAFSRRLDVPLVADQPVTVSAELPLQVVRARILACYPRQDCQMREFFLDPLRRERLGLWESPNLPMQPWNKLRAMNRTDLQLRTGQTVTIESESREPLARNRWVLGALLALAGLLWLSQRRQYRAVA